jgi:hypothetical protein
MPLLHSIDVGDNALIEECLQDIELIPDRGYFNIHTIIGRNTYEFKFQDNTFPNCCEHVGFYTYLGCNVNTENKTEDNIMDFVDIIGNSITTIKFEEKQNDTYDSGNMYGAIFVKFLNGEEDILFTLEFYNWQNGYYPHELIVNLYEGNSKAGMQIFKTCI